MGTYTDNLTSVKRDYKAHLSLEDRHFLTLNNVNEYNTSLLNMEKLSKKEDINFHKLDTTKKSEEDVSILAANIILDDARNIYIKRLKKEYKIQ
jgi:hypothetical protein